MTRNRRRVYLFAGALSVLLPLVGFTYCLAQGPAPSAGGVSINWPSLLLTLIGMLVGSAIGCGTFRERVSQHGRQLDDHEAQLNGLTARFMPRELCTVTEQASAAAAGVAATTAATAATAAATAAANIASTAATAAQNAASVAAAAAETVAQTHKDLSAISEGIKRLLERQGG
jgi:hypothetical protein